MCGHCKSRHSKKNFSLFGENKNRPIEREVKMQSALKALQSVFFRVCVIWVFEGVVCT